MKIRKQILHLTEKIICDRLFLTPISNLERLMKRDVFPPKNTSTETITYKSLEQDFSKSATLLCL